MRVKKGENLLESMIRKVNSDQRELRAAYKKLLAEKITIENELEYSERIRKELSEETKQLRNELFEAQEKIIQLNSIKNKENIDEYVDWLNSDDVSELEKAYSQAYGNDYTYESEEKNLNQAI